MSYVNMEANGTDLRLTHRYNDDQMEIYMRGEGVVLHRGDVDVLENDINTPVREDSIRNGKIIELYKMWLAI